MNMNVDFFAQMIAEASPLLQNPSGSNSNGQFISPNPNTFASINQSNSDFTSNAADLSNVDILDFIPAAAVAEQHQIHHYQQQQQELQQVQQVQQFQQYLQTPKSAVSPKFQLTGGSNFSANPTPSFGAIASFAGSSDDIPGASASIPVTAQFSPITPNVLNFGSQLNLQAHQQRVQQQQQAAVEHRVSTPSSVQAMGNSPLQFSPQQAHYTSSSRISSASTSVADKNSPTIGLGVSVIDPAPVPAPQQPSSSIMKITKKQPSPHEQAAFQFQQQVNNEAHKSSLNHKRVSSTTSTSTSKSQTQLDAQLQKLIEQQREKQQQQLLLLKKGEIPKPPELKPKRKSSCRPHKQKRRLQQQQQQLQFLQLRKISPPPLQPITGDSPTTIEVASPELDMNNNELSFANNTSAFIFGGNITAEELLSNDPFEALSGNNSLIDCKGDLLSEFVDFEYEETTTGDFEKSITDDDFDFLNLNKTSNVACNNVLTQRPILKKKKSVVSSSNIGTTPTKIGKKTLKKASSFSGGSTPTFIMNPKLQWTKSQTNDQHRQRLMTRNVSHGHTQSMSELGADNNGIGQGMPVFTLSNHYLFVYETADTIYQDESIEDSSTQTTPRKQQNNSMLSEVDLLKNLESGLGEFKLDLNKRK